MSPPARIAGAPISWGVCEAPDWGVQLTPDVVLDELVRAGYVATETGPDGWLPGDGGELGRVLDAHGLELAGAFLPLDLTSRDLYEEMLPAFDRVLDRVAPFPGAVLNIAVMGSEFDEYGVHHALRPDQWRSTLWSLDELAARGAAVGVRCVVHPHVGTAVERPDDVQRVLEGADIDLCLDTGHLAVAGIDPLQLAREASDRIAHVHLKDVDAAIAERWRAGEYPAMRQAVEDGIWRALGDGDAPIEGVLDVLRSARYAGWLVLERDETLSQDQSADDTARVARAIREREWVEARLGAEAVR